MLKAVTSTTQKATTGTDAAESASLASVRKDPYEKRPPSADQIFLQNVRNVMLNHPNMPVDAFSNILRNTFGTQDTRLQQSKAQEIKNLVEENFRQIWHHSIKLLGDEISEAITRIDLVLSKNTTMPDDKCLLEAKVAAAAIANRIEDGDYKADRQTESNDLLTDLEDLHEKLARLITTYKHSHPALAQLRLDQTTPLSEQAIINTASQIKDIFAAGFREYRSLFEAIEKIDLECSQLQIASGMDQQLIRDLSAKWSIEQIREATESARNLGLSDRNLYYVLKSALPSEAGYARALGLLGEIGEFVRSLNPIEARLPQLSPRVSPGTCSSAEDLALAKARIELLRQRYQAFPGADIATKRTIAVEAVRKLLVEMERQCRPHSSPLIAFEKPHNVALFLVYSYADKVDNGKTCLAHSINPGSFRIKHDYDMVFNAGYGARIESQIWESFQELLRAKILVLSPESKFSPDEYATQTKTWSSLAQTISAPADKYLSAIKEVLRSIDREDPQFISAIQSAELIVSNRDARAGTELPKRSKKPTKDLDISGCLDQISQTLKDLEGSLNTHKAGSKRDKINTLVSQIDRYLSTTDQVHGFAIQDLKSLLIGFVKAPPVPTQDYIRTASFALTKAKDLLTPNDSRDEQIQSNALASKSDREHSSHVPAIIPSLNRPDIIGHQLNDILSDLSAEFIAVLYTRDRLVALSNLPIDQAALDEKIRANFKVIIGKYLMPDEFTISQSNGIYVVTIFADPEMAADDGFLALCGQMAVDTDSDLPFVVSVVQPKGSPRPYPSQSDENQGHSTLSAAPDKGLIPISLSANDRKASAGYQPDFEAVVKTVKQTLRLKPESSWIDVVVSEDKILLKPKIPLPTSAISTIIDKLCLLHTPIYLEQPESSVGSISWSEVKSIIKLMLSPSDTITKFKPHRSGKRAAVEVCANLKNLESLKAELSILAKTLKERNLRLTCNTSTLSQKFFRRLSEFNPRVQLSLLKRLDPMTCEIKLDSSISLNRISVEKGDLADVLMRYRELTDPVVVSGHHVRCIDPAGTRLAEDAFSEEVCGDRTKFGIHVVNGAFIVPPDSINRQIAYERIVSTYGDSGEHHYMLPNFLWAGFSPSHFVPSISLFIEIPTALLEETSLKKSHRDITVTITPSVTKVGTMLQYSEVTDKFISTGQLKEKDMSRLGQFAQFIAQASPNTSERSRDPGNISKMVMELLRYFSNQVDEFLTNNEHLQGEQRTGDVSKEDAPRGLYSKPLRHLAGLIGQHRLMAHWGFYSPIGDQQLTELNNRMVKYFKKTPKHRASLQLIAEINQLLSPANSVAIAASEPDDAGRVLVRLNVHTPVTRACYARQSSTTTTTLKTGESIRVKNPRYDLLNDCFIIEY